MSQNVISKMLSSVVKSSAKSLLSSGLKSQVKGLIKRGMQKSPQDIEKEITISLGYLTSHYKLDKDQKVIFRPSSVFMHEWLTNAPSMKDQLVKDEENGQVYYRSEPITNQDKVKIIHEFIRATNAQSSALASHFDNALKLLDPTDLNAQKFKTAMQGWNPSTPSVIDTWMEQCFGSALTSDPAHAKLLFRRWVIGTARRVMTPGSTLDGCLVLVGPTGVGKSQHFRQLLPPPFDNRTGEIYCDVKNAQKLQESLLGHSIATLDEMAAMEYNNSVESLKQWLTSQWIDVRLPWARAPRRFNMRCGIAGTSNKERFITDASLSRRLWVIQLNDSKRMDFDYLTANRKLLWQEAAYRALNNETCIMNPEEQKQIEAHNHKFLIT